MNWSDVWKYARDVGPTVGLLLTAIGLGINGIGLLRNARVARNTFMLSFYDRIQKYNLIDVYLKEGWPNGALGPTTPEDWNQVARYMGLFEGLWKVIQDRAYPIDRADSDYSHRIVEIVRNSQIHQRYFSEESDKSAGWEDFIELWCCLESGRVYRRIAADLLKKEGVVVPKAPRPQMSRRWQPRRPLKQRSG